MINDSFIVKSIVHTISGECIVIVNYFYFPQLHPYIHSVLEIQYMKTGRRHFTISTEFLRKGSVKDFLYNKVKGGRVDMAAY